MGRWVTHEELAPAVAGDEEARERLIAQIWPGCFRLAASVIGDVSAAQDAAQETCVIVHQKIHALRDPAAFDSWLYRIVLRESARVRRRLQSAPAAYEQGFQSDDTAGMDVWRALADLPAPLRDVTVLFYFDDLKSEEIAHILGVPHATVRTRLGRARDRLRAVLADYDERSQSSGKEIKRYVV